jgi:SAM-dependent methyltransferase
MTTQDFDPETLAFYEAEAPRYVTARPDATDPHVSAFLDQLPPGASILELGCGGGRDAAFMIARGFVADLTDGVAAMAEQAEAFLGRPVRVMRFDELDALDRYDAVIANAALLHVPSAGLPDILGRVWRALKPGGLHMATYKTGGGEGRDGHGRHYNRLSRDDLEQAYRMTGDWSLLEIEEFMGEGRFSKPSAWLKIVVQKAMND